MARRPATGPAGLARGALIVSVSATIITAILGAVLEGTRGALSVALAAGLVLAYFISGQLVETVTLRMADSSGMTITMASYAVRVALLGVILWWAMSTPSIAGMLANTWVAAGALVALLGWLTGLMVWHSRARIPIYDKPYEAPAGWDK